jgi:hypothetical protein
MSGCLNQAASKYLFNEVFRRQGNGIVPQPHILLWAKYTSFGKQVFCI